MVDISVVIPTFNHLSLSPRHAIHNTPYLEGKSRSVDVVERNLDLLEAMPAVLALRGRARVAHAFRGRGRGNLGGQDGKPARLPARIDSRWRGRAPLPVLRGFGWARRSAWRPATVRAVDAA